jgi:hypothetical protein
MSSLSRFLPRGREGRGFVNYVNLAFQTSTSVKAWRRNPSRPPRGGNRTGPGFQQNVMLMVCVISHVMSYCPFVYTWHHPAFWRQHQQGHNTQKITTHQCASNQFTPVPISTIIGTVVFMAFFMFSIIMGFTISTS